MVGGGSDVFLVTGLYSMVRVSASHLLNPAPLVSIFYLIVKSQHLSSWYENMFVGI